MRYTYWPYDEVSLSTHNGKLNLKTPWLEASTSQSFFNEPLLTRLSAKLDNKSLTVDDLALVNDFFAHFQRYPLAYILPSPKSAKVLDKHALLDHSLLEGSLEYILKNLFESFSIKDNHLNASDLSELLSLLPRRDWEWDFEAALDFSTINDTIHPESFFSISRRYHLLELLNTDKGNEIFADLQELKGDAFKEALCKLVRQNHYVTQKCQDSLEPALAIAGQASLLIEEFMGEERGHDKILGKALKHLGEEPENIEVNVQTRVLMHLLKLCAERNFLAFSMAIDAFERSNFEEVDPMAQLLIKGGFPKAAEFINLHMKINDAGDHENVAQKFLAPMALCDRDYALEAIRLMEILSLVMGSMTKSVLSSKKMDVLSRV